jgi:hypothetical protein
VSLCAYHLATWEVYVSLLYGAVLFQPEEMWWTPQELALQQQAEAVWKEFPEAQPGLPDIAVAEDLIGDPGGLEWEPAALNEGDELPPAFLWHVPEDVEPGGVPPFNELQAGPEGQLLGAFQAAFDGIGPPPAADEPPE